MNNMNDKPLSNEEINDIKTITRRLVATGIKIFELSNPPLESKTLHSYDFMEYRLLSKTSSLSEIDKILVNKRDYGVTHSSLNSHALLLPLIISYSNFLCLLLHNKRIFSYKLLPHHENNQLLNISLIPTKNWDLVDYDNDQHQYLFIILTVVRLIFSVKLSDLQSIITNTNISFSAQTKDQSMFVDEVDMSLLNTILKDYNLPDISTLSSILVLNRVNTTT